MRRAWLGAFVAALTAAAPARTMIASQTPVFSSHVEMVRLDVLVTRNRLPLRGLKLDDFEVRDNGVLQRLDYLGFDEVPLNIVLALDMSDSVAGPPLDHLRSASRAVFGAMKPGDRSGVVTFGSSVAPSAALTSNVTELRAALDHRHVPGETALRDACFAGLMLGVAETGRSLLLVLSDGLDTGSWLSSDLVLETAGRADVVTYGVVVGKTPKVSFLRDLTSATGGDVIEIKAATDLDATFIRLLDEYRARYLIAYVPRGVAKGGWHRLDVRVKGGRGTVKARPAYLAEPSR